MDRKTALTGDVFLEWGKIRHDGICFGVREIGCDDGACIYRRCWLSRFRGEIFVQIKRKTESDFLFVFANHSIPY